MHFDIPEELRECFVAVADYFKTIAGNDLHGRPILQSVPPHIAPVYDYFTWLFGCSGLLRDLHIVIDDIDALPEYCAAPHELCRRYFLLFRTFFNEFFRSREELANILARMRKVGIIDREAVRLVKTEYAAIFSAAIDLRNQLVHSRVGYRDVEKQLAIVATTEHLGYAVVRQDGERITTESVLRRACYELRSALVAESDCLRAVLDHISRALAAAIALYWEAHRTTPEQN